MKYLLTIISLLILFNARAQFYEGLTLEGGASYMNINELKPTSIYSTELNWFVTDNFSLDYSIQAGRKYVHLPASVPLTVYLLLNHDDEDELEESESEFEEEADTSESSSRWGALMALLLPEGVSAHVPVGRKTYITPSIRPMGYEFIGDDQLQNGDMSGAYFTNNLGLKIERFFSRSLFVSIYGNLKSTIWKDGARMGENKTRRGYSFGIRVGGIISEFSAKNWF